MSEHNKLVAKIAIKSVVLVALVAVLVVTVKML